VSHNVVEVFLSDKSIIVEISLVEDVLDFLIGQILAQILSNFLELKGGEFSLH
jgi:hypothetical protein